MANSQYCFLLKKMLSSMSSPVRNNTCFYSVKKTIKYPLRNLCSAMSWQSRVDVVRTKAHKVGAKPPPGVRVLHPSDSDTSPPPSTVAHAAINVGKSDAIDKKTSSTMTKVKSTDHSELSTDSTLMFNNVFAALEKEYKRENICFPKELILLNGAPGSGKGTHTKFLQSFRGIEANPIEMSDLFRTPEFRKIIDSGGLIGDQDVLEQLLRALLKPEYANGAIIDGFPRSAVQVDFLKMLHDKMFDLRRHFADTPIKRKFRRPTFRIAILYVSEQTSVERQVARGKHVLEHNRKVRDSGYGELVTERATDFDESLIKKRYQVFKQHYHALLALKEKFAFHLINAQGSIEEVQASIVKQLEYQSSLELAQETFEALSQLPIASELKSNARQNLVRRLDNYQTHNPQLVREVVSFTNMLIIPALARHVIGGYCRVHAAFSKYPLLGRDQVIDIIIDLLSERGYHMSAEISSFYVPDKFDQNTLKITTREEKECCFTVSFTKTHLRREDWVGLKTT